MYTLSDVIWAYLEMGGRNTGWTKLRALNRAENFEKYKTIKSEPRGPDNDNDENGDC